MLIALWGGLPAGVLAQQTTEFITTQLPEPTYFRLTPSTDYYDHHIGPVQIRYTVMTSATFTDNRNYNSEDAQSDLGLTAGAGIGLLYPLNDISRLQTDFGIGFTYWVNRPEEQDLTLNIIPNSHLSYDLELGNVEVLASNTTSSSMQASDRPEYAGGRYDGTDRAFSQIDNRTSLQAMWGPGRVQTTGRYSFGLTRTLTDDFSDLDRNTHLFGAEAMVEITPPLSAGVYASYSFFTYEEAIQNDGQTASVGPSIQWSPMDTLSFMGRFGYTVSTYDQTGTINDDSEFTGMTFNVSARHDINRRMRQTLIFSRGIDPGFGSNFTDSILAGYSLQADVGPKIHPTLNLTYNRSNISGPFDETADLFTFSLGVGVPVYRRLSAGLSYGLSMRFSNLEDRDYTENRVTLSANYQF